MHRKTYKINSLTNIEHVLSLVYQYLSHNENWTSMPSMNVVDGWRQWLGWMLSQGQVDGYFVDGGGLAIAFGKRRQVPSFGSNGMRIQVKDEHHLLWDKSHIFSSFCLCFFLSLHLMTEKDWVEGDKNKEVEIIGLMLYCIKEKEVGGWRWRYNKRSINQSINHGHSI